MRQSRQNEGKTRAPQPGADVLTQLRLLASLQDELASVADDLPALLTHVASRAQQLVRATGAVIEVTEPGGKVVRATTGAAIGLRGDVSAWRASAAKGRRVPVLRPEVLAVGEQPESQSLVAVPVRSSRHELGVLAVLSSRGRKIPAEEIELLRIMGSIVGVRLEHLEQLREREVLSTENAIAIATLRDSESRFRNAFDNSAIGMALVARDGRWLKVNTALCRTLGHAASELLSRDCDSVTHPDDLALEIGFVEQLLAGETQSYELEKRYLHKNGSIVWAQLTVSVVKDDAGQALYFVSQIQDISARKKADRVLKRLAIRDSLTGLFNRGEMDRLLDDEISRARRHRRALSLVMVDVDRFKQVNDTLGHQAGDRALQAVAKVLLGCVRSHDQVARYGGEEFAIILPETTGADALAVAERMRVRVAAEVFVAAGTGASDARRPLTISVGIATLVEGTNARAEQLVRDADNGLYAAKRGGRNRCVVIAGGPRAGENSA